MIPPESGMDENGRDPRLAALYRAGGESQQPPAHLDDAIRAAARRAVQAGPRRGTSRFRRWSVPLSLAAVIMLSVTVVTMMREEGADRWGADDVRQLPPAPSAGVESPDRAAVEPVPRPAAPAERRMEAAQSSPAAPPAPAERSQAAEKTASGLAEQRERDRPPAEIAVPGPSAAQEAFAGAGADTREDRAPPAAAPPRALRRSAPAAAMADASRGEESMMAKQAAPAAAKPGDPLWQDLEQEPAGKWLERLRELRRDGRSADFARLAAEFRRRFPDTALPDDLR